MKKYLILIPIIGIFAPSFINDWGKFVKENYILFNISLIIHILSVSFLIFCANKN